MAGRFRKYIIDYELEQKVAGPYFPILLVTILHCVMHLPMQESICA